MELEIPLTRQFKLTLCYSCKLSITRADASSLNELLDLNDATKDVSHHGVCMELVSACKYPSADVTAAAITTHDNFFHFRNFIRRNECRGCTTERLYGGFYPLRWNSLTPSENSECPLPLNQIIVHFNFSSPVEELLTPRRGNVWRRH